MLTTGNLALIAAFLCLTTFAVKKPAALSNSRHCTGRVLFKNATNNALANVTIEDNDEVYNLGAFVTGQSATQSLSDPLYADINITFYSPSPSGHILVTYGTTTSCFSLISSTTVLSNVVDLSALQCGNDIIVELQTGPCP